MSTIQRNRKIGGTNEFETEFQLGFNDIRAIEVDDDFNTVFNAWNSGIPNAVLTAGIPPSGAASGDLTGTYPSPSVKDGAITRAKTAPDLWLIPIPTGPDIGKVLAIAPDLTLAWYASPPATLTPGQVTTSYIADAPNGITDAKISSVSWSKITGAPTSMAPSGAAGGDLSGTYPNPSVVKAVGAFSTGGAVTVGSTLTLTQSADPIIRMGSGVPKIDIGCTAGGDYSVTLNYPWGPQDPARSSWQFYMNCGSDQVYLIRRAAGAASGAVSQPFSLTGAGALTLSGQVRATVSRATAQSVATGAWTTLTFDNTITNVGGIFSASDRFTCQAAGYYLFGGSVQWADAGTGGSRRLRLLVAGAIVKDINGVVSSAATGMEVSYGRQLAVNDTVQIQVWQDSGSAQNTSTSPPPSMWIAKVA